MDLKDHQIAWLNATTAAATIVTPDGFDEERFEQIRTAIYDGSVEFITSIAPAVNAALVEAAFPGATAVAGPAPAPALQVVPNVQQSPAPIAAAPAAGPGPAPLPGVSVVDDGKDSAWQDLFANYSGWYDNRADKAAGKGPAKGPDFKRKSDKLALWINSKDTPGWVHQKLAAV